MTTSLSFSHEVKALATQIALRKGAAAVRVTSALEDTETRERLRASFERGDLKTWGYGDQYAERASDPRRVLAHAQSVLCVAVSYATPIPPPKHLHGRVSNYAWSRDYHPRMRALLREIADAIDERVGEKVTAIACDTAPLAERALAARAGLGWVGKHTNVISPEAGSFVFLGEVVTSLALPADEPLRKTCGACARCITACPTGALRGDYTIDATKCISDLTQRTDGIPREMRPLIGTWVWGCDICQMVCPPTRKAGTTKENAALPVSSEIAQPHLLSLLQMTSGTFKRQYQSTAMGWRGAAVLRRNAAVALGNTLDRSTVGALAVALNRDPHPMVRGHIAWALGRIGSPAAIRALNERLTIESDDSVCEEITCASEPFGRPDR